MASGNFVFRNGPSLDSFNKYVVPVLKETDIVVQDRLVCKDGCNSHHLLFSVYAKRLLGPYNSIPFPSGLENAVKEILGKLKEKLWEEAKIKSSLEIYPHEIKNCETVGVYQNDAAAYKLFPSIAQQYLLESIGKQADEVTKEIRGILDSKLSDLV